MSIQMCICPKCAWFKGRRKCDFCNIQMIITDTTIEEVMEMSDKQEKELINHYIETIIKNTYDPKAREYREKMNNQFGLIMSLNRQQNVRHVNRPT